MHFPWCMFQQCALTARVLLFSFPRIDWLHVHLLLPPVFLSPARGSGLPGRVPRWGGPRWCSAGTGLGFPLQDERLCRRVWARRHSPIPATGPAGFHQSKTTHVCAGSAPLFRLSLMSKYLHFLIFFAVIRFYFSCPTGLFGYMIQLHFFSSSHSSGARGRNKTVQ